MADELKTERIQVLLTPSDLKAIDDWSFKNRIRSRGEAIRLLTRLGFASVPLLQALLLASSEIARNEIGQEMPRESRLKKAKYFEEAATALSLLSDLNKLDKESEIAQLFDEAQDHVKAFSQISKKTEVSEER